MRRIGEAVTTKKREMAKNVLYIRADVVNFHMRRYFPRNEK